MLAIAATQALNVQCRRLRAEHDPLLFLLVFTVVVAVAVGVASATAAPLLGVMVVVDT